MDRFFATFGKIILVLLLAGGIGYAGYTYARISSPKTATTTPTPSPFIATTPTTPPPQTVTAGLNHAGGISFPGYTITVPGGWAVDHQNTPGESPTDTLILTKLGYQVKIFQGATGGAPCLYPGDPDQEGPSSRFTSYFQFAGQLGANFRGGLTSGTSSGSQTYTICMKSADGDMYGQPTAFGHITFMAPTKLEAPMLNEMTAMITSLKSL